MGTYVGMMLEEKLALGLQVVRIITNQECGDLIDALKEANLGITVINGQGAKGPVTLIFTIIKRKDLENVTLLINRHNDHAFYTVEDIREVKEGVFPDKISRNNPFGYFRKFLPYRNVK